MNNDLDSSITKDNFPDLPYVYPISRPISKKEDIDSNRCLVKSKKGQESDKKTPL
jgi:hypothetical protein